ncbi:MAG: adenylate/guanylate cyclase domain-containing protein [Bradyrhizobium sp.]|uniref:adenylate/guanylate cyclase domain-containing protein n=1 Tax=Bradyrhizobium sp. TaxID=376 RepID=UPI002720E7C3|nr:adenylate/guanylate cyclase domain-containing protein [Bradyrhizobium sp.]MDO8400869.1 adenylate/guanylate cyclase domain-containing protein [Bradyrhizobium sp.]
MRIGIRLAISGLVLASILVSAVGVHLLWWRTAEANSHALADTINRQIVAAVEKEVTVITTEARAAHTAIRTLFLQNVLETREADKREFVFLSQLQSQPNISWVAFGWPDGAFFAAHKLGDLALEMMEIAPVDGVVKRRVDEYQVVVGDIEFEKRRFENTDYAVTEQEWFRSGLAADEPRWFNVTAHPVGPRPSIAYAGPIDVYQKRQGVLAIIIEYTRLARFLSQLSVGKSGAAFILGSDGTTIAAPDPDADELNMQRSDQPLLSIARRALAGAGPDAKIASQVRLEAADDAYAVTLTPLAFPGWTLATVIPEKEFLGPIEATIRKLLIGLALLILAAGLLSAWLARRVIATPLIMVVDELKHVARFDLDKVRRHASGVTEIENLSGAIADMAGGLAAFRKYIPADLVRMLVREGVEPRPGGAIKPLTILFADIAGFTGLSERLGDRIVPLLSSYLDTMSREVSAHRGTIDKFIGDAVMAFWGAPAANPDHAADACRAALACQRALRESGLTDDSGRPLRVRIGLNSGDVLVGNIGSEVRLNYTVIGDAVNVASRLEGANKEYGTDIIIGEETRRLAGDQILVRELDRLTVYGRAQGIAVYELLGMAEDGAVLPPCMTLYESGLSAYRDRHFEQAAELFEQALQARDADQPARLMLERCRDLLRQPPSDDWDATNAMRAK